RRGDVAGASARPFCRPGPSFSWFGDVSKRSWQVSLAVYRRAGRATSTPEAIVGLGFRVGLGREPVIWTHYHPDVGGAIPAADRIAHAVTAKPERLER